MADPRDDAIARLQAELRRFARERDWERYHTPRNLSALIASEAGELLALFRWGEDALAERPEEVRHELADVFLGVLRFADVAGIDLETAAREKLRLNAEKYPAGDSSPTPRRRPAQGAQPRRADEPRVLAIDWSGANRGERDKIWLAEAVGGRLARLEAGRTRDEVASHLITEAARDPWFVVGLDFVFSAPGRRGSTARRPRSGSFGRRSKAPWIRGLRALERGCILLSRIDEGGVVDYLFVESTEFTRKITKLKLEAELRRLQSRLVDNPRVGRREQGACGLRKVRMGDPRRQQGKSFGARVHYLFLPHRETIYLLNVYGKDEQDALTPQQKRELCARIRPLRAE